MIGRREFLGGLAALAPAAALAQDNGVAAKVNGEAISTYDLVQRMRLLVLLSGLTPDEATVGWLQRYALTGLVNDGLKTQEFARFRSLSELEPDVDAQIARMAGGDIARLAGALNQAQVQSESLRAYLRPQIAWSALVGGRLGGRVQVSDELAAQEAARLSDPASAKLRLDGLFIADLSSGDRANGLAMAGQLAAQIQAGAGREGLSRTFADPSPYGGGEGGRWLLVESLDPAVAAAAAETPAAPVEVREGVLLLTVLERYQPGGATPAPTIEAATARDQLAGDRLASLASRYLRDLKTSAEIS